MISFVGAFFLVRYRVHEAAEEKHMVEVQLGVADKSASDPTAQRETPRIVSRNPQLEGFGRFHRNGPPTHLLEHCHMLCMIQAVAGFLLALIGVLSYVWAFLPVTSRVTATAAMGICVVGAVGIILIPPPTEDNDTRLGRQIDPA